MIIVSNLMLEGSFVRYIVKDFNLIEIYLTFVS